MDTDSTLELGKNMRRVKWVLDRLSHDKSRKAATLAIFQAVPLYYAAVAVKQSGTIMSSTKRDALLADRYKSLIAPAFLRFLQEEYDFQTPPWLTIDLMGQTTLADYERRYFDPTKDAIWDRYQQAGRDIRKTVAPWINEWMAKSGFGETPPPWTHDDDFMRELHEHLWRGSRPGAARKMDQAEFQRRSARGEHLEVVRGDDEDGTPLQVVDGPGSTQGGTEEPTGQEGGGAGGASNPIHGATPANEEPDQGDSAEGPADPLSSGARPLDPGHAGIMMTVRAAMPENWVHRYSLVICFFSKISEQPDPDLDLSSTNGPPPSKKARISVAGSANAGDSCGVDGEDETETACPQAANGRLSRRSLSLLEKASECHGRKDEKEQKPQGVKDSRVERCLESFADRLSASCDQSRDVLAESLQGIASVVRDAGVIRRERFDIERRLAQLEERSERIEWLKLEIHTLEDMGWSADARKAKVRLVTLLRQPLPCDVPLGSGDAGSGDGGGSNGRDVARSGAFDANNAAVGGKGGTRGRGGCDA